MNSETSSLDSNLTVTKSEQESGTKITEPEGHNDPSESIKGFQASLQKKQEEIKELREQLRAKAEAERRAKEAELSEVERANIKASEMEAKAAKLELGILVRDHIAGKNLPKAIENLLLRNPWAIPEVTEEIDNGTIQNNWEDITDAVRRHLPKYVESLVIKKETPIVKDEELPTRRIDSERSIDSTVVLDHIYTEEEIRSLDDKGWEKNREAILRQLGKNGGQLPR